MCDWKLAKVIWRHTKNPVRAGLSAVALPAGQREFDLVTNTSAEKDDTAEAMADG